MDAAALRALADRVTDKHLALLRIVASTPYGRIDCYAKRLDPYCDDKSPTDTINECFEAGWLRQSYDGDSDSGVIILLNAGRDVLKALRARAAMEKQDE